MLVQSFHSKITACKISEFHTERLPRIILPDGVGDAVVNQHPVFCHLVYISVCTQLLCYIKAKLRSFFSSDIKLQHTRNILPQIIYITTDTSCFLRLFCSDMLCFFRCIPRPVRLDPVQKSSFITVDHLNSRLILLRQFSLRYLLFCYDLCLCPVTVII